MKTQSTTNSINRSPLRYGLFLIALVLACLPLSPTAQAVTPAPDGGYFNANTAEGDNALFSLTSGLENTAIGYWALLSNQMGSFNTAIGGQALSNATGSANTATGAFALYGNTAGSGNTASGGNALFSNTTGSDNMANGINALYSNTTGTNNMANGVYALYSNTTGNGNIALGSFAGQNLTTGDSNIDIGNRGVAAEANTIRIGEQANQNATFIAGINGVDKSSGNPVFIDANGQLGTGTAGFVSGALLELVQGTPAPAGFTKIGTNTISYKNLAGHRAVLNVDLYQKD